MIDLGLFPADTLVGKPVLIQAPSGNVYVGTVTAIDAAGIWLDLAGYATMRRTAILSDPARAILPRSVGVVELASLGDGIAMIKAATDIPVDRPRKVQHDDDRGMAWKPLSMAELQKSWINEA